MTLFHILYDSVCTGLVAEEHLKGHILFYLDVAGRELVYYICGVGWEPPPDKCGQDKGNGCLNHPGLIMTTTMIMESVYFFFLSKNILIV